MVSATDGSAFTSTVSCLVTGDGGTQGAGGGAVTHEGNGFHSYAPTQAETNYTHIAFTFTGSGAIPATIQTYTEFPQTGDSFARIGAPAAASIAADLLAIDNFVDGIEASLAAGVTVTTNNDKTGYGLSSAAVQAIWDALTSALTTVGSIGKRLVDYLTGDIYARIGAPAGASVSADIAAVKVETAAILVDTDVIGAAGAGLTALATQASVNTIDDFLDTEVAAILAAVDTEVAAIKVVTDAQGATGTGLTAIPWNAAWDTEVQSECADALTAYDPPTNAEMEARTPTAAQLAYIVSNAADGVPVTFSGGTTTTAVLVNVDGAAASSVDDFYNGRILIFNASTLDMQATDITDYVGSTKTATITAVTTAVTSSHTANLK
jgi:hypothetical protein